MQIPPVALRVRSSSVGMTSHVDAASC